MLITIEELEKITNWYAKKLEKNTLPAAELEIQTEVIKGIQRDLYKRKCEYRRKNSELIKSKVIGLSD